MRQPKQAKGTAESQVLAGNQHTPTVNRAVYGAPSDDTAKTHASGDTGAVQSTPPDSGHSRPRARTREDLLSRSAPQGECRVWQGARTGRGYGTIAHNGRSVGTHRLAYELWRGPIPDGLHVCHSCDVRACINPDHLWLGTHVDNMRDRGVKGRCVTPRGESHPSAKMSRAVVGEIRRRAAAGERQKSIATKMGFTLSSVGRVVRGETWKSM